MRLALTLLFLSLVVSGCSSPSRRSVLDARAVSALGKAYKVELRVDPDGAISKIEVYTLDAAQIPEAVKKLAESEMPGGKAKAYEYEVMGDGSEAFEVEVTLPDGTSCEMSASRDGALLYRECQMPLDKVPATIKTAALAVVPGAEIVEVESKKGPSIDEFDVELKTGAEVHKVRLSSSGQVLAHVRKIVGQIEIPVR